MAPVRPAMGTIGAIGAAVLSVAAQAQPLIVNGDFQAGTLAPWVVTPTTGGTSLGTGLGVYDIDGPEAPAQSSLAARFMVGKTSPAVPGSEGVEITQPVELVAGRHYTIWVRWAVKPWMNVHEETGGEFDLIVGGEVLASAAAPPTTGLVNSYGWLRGDYVPSVSGPHALGVRITRPVVAGEEVFQYLDNFGMTNGCWADCNLSGSLTVQDFSCFQNRFVQQSPYADCNGSGHLSIADFGCWRTAFVSGCP